jgi:hypothetical protein
LAPTFGYDFPSSAELAEANLTFSGLYCECNSAYILQTPDGSFQKYSPQYSYGTPQVIFSKLKTDLRSKIILFTAVVSRCFFLSYKDELLCGEAAFKDTVAAELQQYNRMHFDTTRQ